MGRGRGKRTKVRPFSVRLLTKEVDDPEVFLTDSTRWRQFSIRETADFAGQLFIADSYPKNPPWVDFLLPGILDPLALHSQSASAVLLLNTAGRSFAFTFGYGWQSLKKELIEGDFGLKIALNCIDPKRLYSIDMQTNDELTLHTRRQASRGSPLDVFGVDVTRDMMRAVTGKPNDQNIARKMTGSDSLSFHAPLEFEALGDKCKQLLELYQREDYKKEFGFIDHLRPVRDLKLVDKLDRHLIDALRKNRGDTLYLAPPKTIDWERFGGFTYSTAPDGQDHAELDLDDYLETVIIEKPLMLSDLNQDQVMVTNAETGGVIEQWSIYECIVYEAMIDDVLYTLSAGKWFQVDATFSSRIHAQVKEIKPTKLKLPAARAREDEATYNQRAARENRALLCLDRRLIKPEDATTSIEFCDLLSSSRQFIHVKSKTRSSTLSHLFAQGVASAESFLWDAKFRDDALRLVPRMSRAHRDMLPKERPNPESFEVVFAIISRARKHWPLSLPFLSQLNLVHATQRLRRIGYNVSLLHIDQK